MVHSEPRMAVRTPASSAFDDCGDVMKARVSQLRNSSRELGSASASARIAARLVSESSSDQLLTISGSTTRASTSS